MARQQRQYSEDDRAVALAYYASCGQNMKKTARDCGFPEATLRGWLKGKAVNAPTREKSHLKKLDLDARLEALVHSLLDVIPDKLDDAPLREVATALGIGIDKMQLLRSKPTEIIEDASLTDERRAARIAEILQSARDRRDRQSADAAEGDTAEA